MKAEEEAKKIMDEFLAELEKIDQDIEIGLVREHTLREDDAPPSGEGPEFRVRMFSNAPKVEQEQLKMEKKHW